MSANCIVCQFVDWGRALNASQINGSSSRIVICVCAEAVFLMMALPLSILAYY